MDVKNVIDNMRNTIQEQIKEAYMEGAHQGAISTCALIYATMQTAGLEESNFLFEMLKDIAQRHGCENLKEVIEKMSNKAAQNETNEEPTILS